MRGPFRIAHVNLNIGGKALLDVLVSCELRAVLSYLEKPSRKDFVANNFAAAYGTWLHPGTKKPYTLNHWFMRQTDFKYVTAADVNSVGGTDHRLVRLDLVFKLMPRRLRAVKPRIDRTLLEDPVVKLKSQTSVVDFIDRCGSERPVCCAYHTLPKTQVWLRIRCRLVIRALISLQLVCWMLHLHVLQRGTLRW